jgi:hypothetical protein
VSDLPLLLQGLQDADEETRVRAAATLNHIIHPLSNAINNDAAVARLKQVPDLKQRLVACSQDMQLLVRGGCADALLFLSDRLEPSTLDHLLALYHRETSDGFVIHCSTG